MAAPSMPTCLSVTVTNEVGGLVPQPRPPVGPVSPGMGLARERVAAEERRTRREDFMVGVGMGGVFGVKCKWILRGVSGFLLSVLELGLLYVYGVLGSCIEEMLLSVDI